MMPWECSRLTPEQKAFLWASIEVKAEDRKAAEKQGGKK
jgi:hypothetical protein